jgi:hypothetical protein
LSIMSILSFVSILFNFVLSIHFLSIMSIFIHCALCPILWVTLFYLLSIMSILPTTLKFFLRKYFAKFKMNSTTTFNKKNHLHG